MRENVFAHLQSEVRLRGQRDRWSQVPRPGCEFLTLMFFVITPDGFEFPDTFFIATTPEAISSWMNRNRCWTCFVFLEVPSSHGLDESYNVDAVRRFVSKRSDQINKLFGQKVHLRGKCDCRLSFALRSDQGAGPSCRTCFSLLSIAQLA